MEVGCRDFEKVFRGCWMQPLNSEETIRELAPSYLDFSPRNNENFNAGGVTKVVRMTMMTTAE